MNGKDELLVNCAIVIERANNGVIVRPHRGWYQDCDDVKAFTMNEIKVFNDLKDFERWFAEFFPKAAT